MAAVRGPEEVYRKFLDRFGLDEDGDPDALALFTFSLVERDRFDWLEHYRHEAGGGNPTEAQIRQWYADKPESYFEDKCRLAQEWYVSFARALLEDEVKQRIRREIDDSIVSVVRANTSGWKPFWVNVIAGVVAGALFASITIGGYIFVKLDPSVNAMAKSSMQDRGSDK